jgi:DNA mismatch repair ATPase MutS
MKKLYIQITIVLLTLFALYYAFNNYKSDNKYDIEIERLNKINDSLFIANKKIEIEINAYIEENKIKEGVINGLMNRDSILKNQIKDITFNLKKYKTKYEEAMKRIQVLEKQINCQYVKEEPEFVNPKEEEQEVVNDLDVIVDFMLS